MISQKLQRSFHSSHQSLVLCFRAPMHQLLFGNGLTERLCSRRQCCVRVPLMAIASNKRLRRDVSVEVWLRCCLSIWNIVQVSWDMKVCIASPASNPNSRRSTSFGNERFKPRHGTFSHHQSLHHTDIYSQQLFEHPRKQQTQKKAHSTM